MHVGELDTPALVVDLDIMEANVEEMAVYAAAHGLALRPHTKAHHVPAIARRQLQSGARGITVAKLGEAELLARAGCDDLLIAYPIVGAGKLERLAMLAGQVRVTVATDSLEVAQGISEAAARRGVVVRLLAELDAGMRRCGVETATELAELGREMARLPGVRFAGFMFFPGHIWAPPDEQKPALDGIDARLREAQDLLFRSGIEIDTVSGGSTPTARQSHWMKTLTEIRPGTYVFNDMNTAAAGGDTARCALTVHVTVISRAVAGRIVVDGGSLSFSSAPLRIPGAGFGRPVGHSDVVLEAMSDEHGHVDVSACSRRFSIGERMRFIPNHVVATVNLHDEIWAARGGEVVERWAVEGRGLGR